MVELLLAAGAAYLGYRAARKIGSAYSSAKAEMHEEQKLFGYNNQPQSSNVKEYIYYPNSNKSNVNYRQSNDYYGGNLYRSGQSYTYR